MSKQTAEGALTLIAVVLAAVVTGLAVNGAGAAALYATAFGATVLICGLEYLRRQRSASG
jgi:hypothetical protein